MDLNFETHDRLDRKKLADRLIRAISTFHVFKKDAYVLSLNASYGSGKSTFLRMWKTQLEEDGYKVALLDAWETDFAEDPLIPIISSLLKEIGEEEKIKTALRGALGAFAYAGNSLLDKVTGINIKETGDAVKADLTNANIVEKGKMIYEDFSYKMEAYKNLKEALSNYISKADKKPLIILVDELDRVRPDYAVKFLEAIKHVFSVQGVCFVLAVDRTQLEKSIRQMYGEIEFNGYYRRFITREVTLPQASATPDLSKFIHHIAEDYFNDKSNNGLVFAFSEKQKNAILNYIQLICRTFSLSAREVELLFRIYTHLMAIKGASGGYHEASLTAPLIMIALLIKQPSLYAKIGNGKASPQEKLDFIDTLHFIGRTAKQDKRTLMIDIVSFGLTENNSTYTEEADKILKVKLDTQNPNESIIPHLARRASAYAEIPYDKSKLQDFYEQMEDWRTFLEE